MRLPTVVALAVSTASSAQAGSATLRLPDAYHQNAVRSGEERRCEAVRALTAAQGRYADERGDFIDGTWEWERGSGRAATNAAGIVATALAATAAQEARENDCGARQALARFSAQRATAHRRGEFLFDPDIEVLAQAADVLGAPQYRTVAREAFEARYGGATGRELVERWLMTRNRSLVGFDAALAIRAAVAVGHRATAVGLADATFAAVPRWGEGRDDGHLTVSRGALLEAVMALDPDRYRPQLEDLIHHLLLTQSTVDGTWGARNTQATAYAVLGLSAAKREHAVEAANRGRRFLRLSQLKGGLWATFNDFVPEPFVSEVVHEVSAEALRAVALR